MGRKTVFILVSIACLLVIATVAVLFLLPQEAVETHKVTFQNFDGSVLQTVTVEHGQAADAPIVPEREGYTFAGWDKDFSVVTMDIIVTAEYIRITDTTFTVGTVTVAPDAKTATVAVSITNNPGILGMALTLEYDAAALKLVDAENGLALSALTFQTPTSYQPGCIFVWYGSETGGVMDGEILTLTFELTEEAKPGTYPITVNWKDRDIYDSNCDMINPTVTPGAITIFN